MGAPLLAAGAEGKVFPLRSPQGGSRLSPPVLFSILFVDRFAFPGVYVTTGELPFELQ